VYRRPAPPSAGPDDAQHLLQNDGCIPLLYDVLTTLPPVLALLAVALPSSAIASGTDAAVGTGGGGTPAVPAAGPDPLAERIDARMREAELEECELAHRDPGSGRDDQAAAPALARRSRAHASESK